MSQDIYYWKGNEFELTIAKRRGLIVLSIKKGENQETASFTRKEFSSFICEVVKYILSLPVVARRIPFYLSCATSHEKPHGLLLSQKLRPDKNGDIWMKVNRTWAKYHGIRRGDEVMYWREGEHLMSAPLKSKAKIIQDAPPRWEGKETFIVKVE